MKQLLLTLCIGLTAAGSLKAQMGYDFSYKTGQPYTPLTAGTRISTDTPWGEQNLVVNMPFTLKIGGIPTSKFYIAFNTLMPATDTVGIVNAFMPLKADLSDLADRGKDTGGSSIRYTIEGAAPSRIFKLEYWNAGFADPETGNIIDNDSINFQVWVYETSDIIEFHYGDAHITDPDLIFSSGGPLVAYFRKVDIEEGDPEMAYMLNGDPAAPTIDSTSDLENSFILNRLPASGTVYSFKPVSATASVGEKELLSKFSVYPTRSASSLYINNLTGLRGSMEVYSTSGQQVIDQMPLSSGHNELNLSQLPAAMYLLQVVTTEGRAVYRFIKE